MRWLVLALLFSESRSTSFVSHEVATGLNGGYQVIAADLNRDGKPDLVAVATGLTTVTWYENPSWTPHVLASGVRAPINASAFDIDGDGVPEIALAYGFSTSPAQSTGNVVLLTHGANVNEPWTVREIDRTPSAHRLRWLKTTNGDVFLVNSPLAAPTASAPNYEGNTPVYAYRPPDWKRETVTTEERGVVHAIEPIDGRILAAGFAGIHAYEWKSSAWTRTALVVGDPAPVPKSGSSDVAVGHTASSPFLAAIEPWHGNEVVVYRAAGNGWSGRTVIDTTVVDGHTVVVADFDGDGNDEIVLGQRGGTRSVWMYSASANGKWTRSTLDDGTMAAAGCTAVDLNADRRLDLACIGTATANLKWYENR